MNDFTKSMQQPFIGLMAYDMKNGITYVGIGSNMEELFERLERLVHNIPAAYTTRTLEGALAFPTTIITPEEPTTLSRPQRAMNEYLRRRNAGEPGSKVQLVLENAVARYRLEPITRQDLKTRNNP